MSGERDRAIRHKLIPTLQNLITSTPLTTTYELFFWITPLISSLGLNESIDTNSSWEKMFIIN